MLFYKKIKNDKGNLEKISVVLFFLVCIECIVNGYSTFYKEKGTVPTNYYDSYKLWNTVTERALDSINDEEGFFRISCKDDFIVNSPTYFNYNGISSFSNLENYEVRRTLGNIGLLTSTRDIFCNGLTDFSRMILAVRYDINTIDYGDHRSYITDFGQSADVIKNDNCLSLGFLVNDDITNFEFCDRNQFTNINDLASCMIGRDVRLYEMLDGGVELHEVGANVVQDSEDVIRFVLDTREADSGFIYFSVPLDDRDAFIQFDYGESAYDQDSPIIFNGTTPQYSIYERLSTSFIKPLERIEDCFVVAIYMRSDLYENVYAPTNINIAYYNKDAFIDVYNELKNGQLKVIDYDNGYVHGQIDVEEDNKILFTSIPYNEGWEISVNGEKTEPVVLLDGAFIGLKLAKGSNDIIFEYHVPGFKTGCIITLISLVLLIGLLFINPQINANIRQKKNENE